MNRRSFLNFLGAASLGAAASRVYSFPSIIVPQNLIDNPDALFSFNSYAQPPRGLNLSEISALCREHFDPVVRETMRRSGMMWARILESEGVRHEITGLQSNPISLV